MNEITYREVAAKSALNRSAGIRASWTLNPYRGCPHACRYCYARKTHAYLNLGVGEDFERTVLCKTNLPDVLAQELVRPGLRAMMRRPDAPSVVVGTAADPYQPIEGRFRITRRALETLASHAIPCTIITKGTLVVRDRDVLRRLSERARVHVLFSLSTVDPAVARLLEPGAPSPASRLRALAMLREAGVPASVLLCPVVPGFTDAPEQLAASFRAAAAAGAENVEVGALRLAPLVREHFLDFLARERPALVRRYLSLYRQGADPAYAYRDALYRQAATLRRDLGFPDYSEDGPEAREPAEPVQLGFAELGG